MKRALATTPAASFSSAPRPTGPAGDAEPVAAATDDETETETTPSKLHGHHTHPSASDATKAIRTVAVLLDGLARAAVLPFGPALVAHHLGLGPTIIPAAGGGTAGGEGLVLPDGAATALSGGGAVSAAAAAAAAASTSSSGSDDWTVVSTQTAYLVAIYTLGRCVGTYLGSLSAIRARFVPSDSSSGVRNLARTAGVAVALHLFTFGAGLDELCAIKVVRFCSAVVSGLMCRVTAASSSPLAETATTKDAADAAARATTTPAGDAEGGGGSSHSDGREGTVSSYSQCDARAYLTGFAISALSSGLLYPVLRPSQIYRALTGGYPRSISALFFVGVVGITELILGLCCFGSVVGRGRGAVLSSSSSSRRHGPRSAAVASGGSSSRREPRRLQSAMRNITQGCRRRRRGASRWQDSGSGVDSDWDEESHHLPLHELPSSSELDGEPTRDGGEVHISWQTPATPHAAADDRDHHVELHEFHDPLSHSRHGLPYSHPPSTPAATSLFPNDPMLQSPPLLFTGTPTTQPFNRARADSNHSVHSVRSDVFFDCSSVHSDGIGMDGMDDLHHDDLDLEMGVLSSDGGGEPDVSGAEQRTESLSDQEGRIARYVDRRCIYPDGSPSYVPAHCNSETVPPSYLQFYNSNVAKARTMWQTTQRWRREMDVWKIHSLPHPYFDEIKKAYPHFIHGYSKAGYPVVYEQPGKMNLKGLFANGCSVDEMIRHYTYLMEYVSNIVVERKEVMEARLRAISHGRAPEPWGTMVVMDVSGASVSSLSGDVVKYLKRSGDTNSAHYPMTLKRVFVANSPFWLSGVWSSMRKILPESVHVDLLSSSRQMEALREYIDDDQIPREYGGSSPYPLGEHPFELGLVKLVETHNAMPCSDDSSSLDLATTGASRGTNDLQPAPVVRLQSASSRASTSASTSFDEEDGHLVDVPFTPQQTDINVRNRSSRRRPGPSVGDACATAATPALSAPRHNDIGGERERGEDTVYPPHTYGNEGDEHVLAVTSIMHMAWCSIHGLVEATLAPWMLCSPILGGLGYGPGRTGVTAFCACIVLMWMSRTVVARLASRVPCSSPMRAYRIGVGSMAVLLGILPTIPATVTSVSKKDSVLVLASTMILLSCIAVAAMVGRYASVILHERATICYAGKQAGAESLHVSTSCCADRLLREYCQSGRLSTFLGIVGEITGALLAGPLFGWSTNQRRPFPFDGACCFYVSALLCSLLYVVSYSLHVGSNGDFLSHPQLNGHEKGNKSRTTSRCALVSEVATVAVSDMASLFEESNWSSSAALGFSRGKQQGQRERAEKSHYSQPHRV